MVNKSAGERVCKNCGTEENEVLSSGFLGCPLCYETFWDIISNKFENTRKGSCHMGKRPLQEAVTAQDEYSRLSAELQKAVQVEDYKRVSALLTQMRSLRDGRG